MATTFSVGNFKNPLIGFITGLAGPASTYRPYYVMVYNGSQPADPSTAPAGSSVFASYSATPPIGANMTAAGGNISQLNAAATYVAANTVGSLTFARIHAQGGNAMIDTPVSLSGGGGGVILDSLASSAGNALGVTAYSIKLPKTNGATLYLSQSLADRLVDNLTNANLTQPGFGINTTGGSTINIYSGSLPADADATPTGTLLAVITIGSTQVFNAAVGGSASLVGPLTSAVALATGTATYARWIKTNGSATFTIQGSVGTSGTDFIINTTTIVSGVTYQITDATLSI